MKTLACCIGLGLLAATAAADPAADFVGTSHRTTDRSLAASSGSRFIEPVDTVAFALDSQALDATAQSQIAATAGWMKDHHHQRLVLEGHTDRIGNTEYNDDLGRRRAEMVRNHLIVNGIDPDRVVIAVFGESGARPTADRDDRKVVMYATMKPVSVVVHELLDAHEAHSVVWTDTGTVFHESRGTWIGRL
jgi:outer membrane protein OmpA-like peptidoglycan-associated protein